MLFRSRGLTLIELLVVLVIVASVTAGAIWSVQHTPRRQLQQEASRLAALFEAARAQSQLTGQRVSWSVDEHNRFVWQGLNAPDWPTQWQMTPAPRVQWPEGQRRVVLGPEPVMAALRLPLLLHNEGADTTRVELHTDGLAPVDWREPAP